MDQLGQAIAAVDRRVTTVEQDLAVIKGDIAGIKAHYATKDDVSDAKNAIIMWVVGSALFAQLLASLIKAFSG